MRVDAIRPLYYYPPATTASCNYGTLGIPLFLFVECEDGMEVPRIKSVRARPGPDEKKSSKRRQQGFLPPSGEKCVMVTMLGPSDHSVGDGRGHGLEVRMANLEATGRPLFVLALS